MQLICFTACSESDDIKEPSPELKLSIPENNAIDVSLSSSIELVFNEEISLVSNHGITINHDPVSVEATSNKLVFAADLKSNTIYTIIILKGAVINAFDVPLDKNITITFTTEEVIDDNSNVDNSSMEFISDMGAGWNLGNTLDTKDADETAWGNPKASKELIDAIRVKGFKTLRIPTTWQYHMGAAPDFIIDEAWLDRVEEIVNYGLDNEMYVIVNIHHDEEWLIPTYAEVDRTKEQLGKVWTQIANRFKSYDNHLIFETLNETRLKGSAEEWNGGTSEGHDCINKFHEAAVKAIRTTGEMNADRYIMVSPYAASTTPHALNDLVLPSSSHLIVSVHSYSPYKFSLAETGYTTTWGTEQEKQSLDSEFDKLVTKFISKGIPVVMGESGQTHTFK